MDREIDLQIDGYINRWMDRKKINRWKNNLI